MWSLCWSFSSTGSCFHRRSYPFVFFYRFVVDVFAIQILWSRIWIFKVFLLMIIKLNSIFFYIPLLGFFEELGEFSGAFVLGGIILPGELTIIPECKYLSLRISWLINSIYGTLPSPFRKFRALIFRCSLLTSYNNFWTSSIISSCNLLYEFDTSGVIYYHLIYIVMLWHFPCFLYTT